MKTIPICLVLLVASIATAQQPAVLVPAVETNQVQPHSLPDGPTPAEMGLYPGEECCASEPLSTETNPKLNPNSDFEVLLDSFIPRPYLLMGPELGGPGYRVLALLLEGGLNMEKQHFFMNALASYDNDRKTNDGDQPNPKGHDRYLQGNIDFRLPYLPPQLHFLGDPKKWSFGVGYRWSQLSTTNYVKAGNRPQFGGAYDWSQRVCSMCHRDFSMRIAVNYFSAGNDWQNGSRGFETDLTSPTPREDRHWFWRERIELFRFNETVTEPANYQLVQSQKSVKALGCTVDFGVVYRF